MVLNFKLWLEVRYDDNLVAQIKQELEKDGFCTLWLDPDGNVQIGYPMVRPKNMGWAAYRKFENKVQINGSSKYIMYDTIGNTVKPAVKKLIKFLLDNGIIDKTWTIKNDKIGEYTHGSRWTTVYPDHPRTVGQAAELPVFSAGIQNITLFHGTSSYDWAKIQKSGALYPLFMGSNKMHGFESRAKHHMNKDLLYLATNRNKAWDYAKTRASDAFRKVDPEGYKWTQYDSACNRKITPVLLKIQIPDITKLRADDDVINDKMRRMAEKIWNKKPPEEKERLLNQMSAKQGWDVRSVGGAFMWRDTDEGFAELLSRVKPKAYNAWLASILRQDQVAYKGFIPLKFIEEIPVCNAEGEAEQK